MHMNGGAYGGETGVVLIEATGIDRPGHARSYYNADMDFSIATQRPEDSSSPALYCGAAPATGKDRRRDGRHQASAKRAPGK